MLPDRVLNPGPLTYESGELPIALRGPADSKREGTDQELTLSFSTYNGTPSKTGQVKTQDIRAWLFKTNNVVS